MADDVPTSVSLAELEQLHDGAGELRGWDFSRVRLEPETTPWEYPEVARRFLRPGDAVLDIGTGGGELFLGLADAFAPGRGTGIDADTSRIAAARGNLPAGLSGRIAFEAMDARELRFPDASFDAVLSSHSRYWPAEAARVLRPGGHLVAERIGDRINQPIFDAFGWGSSGGRTADGLRRLVGDPEPEEPAADVFRRLGCAVVAAGEKDVRAWFRDLPSLVLYLKSVPLPEPFSPRRHVDALNRYLAASAGPSGYATNVHTELLVVRVPDGSEAH